MFLMSEWIVRYSQFPTEGITVVICVERADCLNFWTHFVSFPQSDNKEELTFLIKLSYYTGIYLHPV